MARVRSLSLETASRRSSPVRAPPHSSSTFGLPGSDISIVVRPTKALTPGDVLREVDGLQILAPADYLVVQAGFLGNVDLKDKVHEFTERRKADPSLTMSCIVRPIVNKCVFVRLYSLVCTGV